jgi:hypothetical protein
VRRTHAFHSKTAFLFHILSFNEMPVVILGDAGSSSTVEQLPESLSALASNMRLRHCVLREPGVTVGAAAEVEM